MELLILLLMILLNGLFAMSELAMVSSRKVRLQQLAEAGSKGARTALVLAADPSRFLATVQVGITAIGILSGAYGEAALLGKLTPLLAQLPWVADHAESIGMGIIVVGLTYVSLILGELAPKRLAMHHPETLAVLIAQPMYLLSRLSAPFIHLLSFSAEALLRLFGMRERTDPPVTGEEIQELMKQGADAGVFEQHEQMLVKRVLQLDERRMEAIMTPRLEIDFLNLDDPIEANLQRVANSHHTRFPVCRGGLDQVIGVLDSTVLLKKHLAGEALDLAQLAKSPVFVPATVTIMSLLEHFRRNKTDLVLVVDEFGGIEGAVTLTDLLEEVVGELETPATDADQAVVIRDDGSLLLDGSISLARLRELTDLATPFPHEAAGGYHTLGGMVMAVLERVPRVADHFVWEGYRFDVMDMDRNRVDRVMVQRLPEQRALDPAASPTEP